MIDKNNSSDDDNGIDRTEQCGSENPIVLNLDETALMVRLGMRTIQRMVATGEFPKPLYRNKNCWLRERILSWLREQDRKAQGEEGIS